MRSALLALAAAAVCGWSGAAEELKPLPPRGPRATLPAQPIYSRDGRIVVMAPAAKAAYRSPVLIFADRVRADLARATHLAFEPENGLLEIAIGSKSDGDASVKSSRLRDPATGAVRERIELPDAEHADLGRFRVAVCKAFLRLWIVDAAPDARKAEELPEWIFEGVARYLDRGQRQIDLDRTLLLWSHACLPPAAELAAWESDATTKEPAVAAALAEWMIDKQASGAPLEAILRSAANGSKWSAAAAARMLAGTEDPLEFDARLDRKFVEDGRKVIVPGVTTDGVMRRFRATLLLCMPLSVTFDCKSTFGKSFAEAAEAFDAAGAYRKAALAQAGRVRLAAMGRDGTLLAVADEYARFLLALAKGRDHGEVMKLLAEAEAGRAAIEKRTAKGEVLRAEGAIGREK